MASFRKLILRLLLAALAMAAVAGAAAVLVSGGTVAWRIVCTALATAVASGLMIPLTLLGDREKQRTAGVFGLLVVVAEFFLSLALIWSDHTLFSSRTSESIAWTMLWLALCGAPAIYFLSAIPTAAGKIAGWGGSILCAVTFALFEIGAWANPSWRDYERWFGIAGAIGGFGLLGVGSLAGSGWKWWRPIGVIAALLAMTMATYAIWLNIHRDSTVFTIIISVAVVVAHANLSMLCPLNGAQKWIRIVTIAAVIACAALVDVTVATDGAFHSESPLTNFAGAAGIIAGCGTLAMGVIARLNRNIERPAFATDIKQITLICPMCQKRQTIGVNDEAGGSHCEQCGLGIRVHVEVPRCAKCDYVLLMIQSDRCPECGTATDAATV